MSSLPKSIPLDRHESDPETRSRPWLVLAIMVLSLFMTTTSINFMNVAVPSLQRSLHASFADVQFVMTGYTLAYAVILIIGGRLGDRFGRKKVLWIGVAGFTLTSLLCGLSPEVNLLILLRIFQGLCAALITPQVLSLIQVNFPPAKRGTVFGLYGATIGLSASTGQAIGGLFLHWNPWGLEWRMLFFFGFLIGTVILLMISPIRESKEPHSFKLDWTGALIVAAGLFMLVYPLVEGVKEGWPLAINICLILSLPVLAVFVWYEQRLALRGGIPLMNVSLFRQGVFTVGMLIVLLLYCGQAAFLLVCTYFFQVGLSFTALHSGLLLLPTGIGIFLASLLSSRGVAKFGIHVLTFGQVVSVIGYLALVYSVQKTGTSIAGYEWIPAFALIGLGQGFVAAPLTNAILAKIRKNDIGSASGIVSTGTQIGLALGIALIGIVLLSAMGQHADRINEQIAPQLRGQLLDTHIASEQADTIVTQFKSCYTEYAHSNDPTNVPAACQLKSAAPEVKRLFAESISIANKQNYTDSFIFCLYAIAAFSAVVVPLLFVLSRKRNGSSSS